MNPAQTDKFLRYLFFLLVAILFIKIFGFFTISENIVVTRILKVIMRVGMTGVIILVYQHLVKRGLVSSFHHLNTLAPIFYGMYLFLGLISIFWSTNPGYSLLQWVMAFEGFVFAYFFVKVILLINHYYPDSYIRFSSILMVSTFFILLVFVVGKFIDPNTFFRLTHGGEESRLGGYLMNPNELGMLAAVGIGSAMLELTLRRKKILVILLILVMGYGLFLTGSRSTMVGMFLLVLFFAKKSKSRWIKSAIVIGAILAVPVVIQTIFIKQGDIGEVLSMTGRLPFWEALLTEGLPQRPLFGFGFMRIAYKDYFESVHTYAGQMTHNTFIQVLMNLGFVGFFIVIVQMTFTLRGYILSKDTYRKGFFIVVFIPIIINSFTEFGIFGEANFGILFYQLLIFLFVLDFDPRYTRTEEIILKKTFGKKIPGGLPKWESISK